MLTVSIRKVQDATDHSKEQEVEIRVLMNTPIIGADPMAGIVMRDAPQICISQVTVTYKEMKLIMDIHNLKNWQEVRTFIEQKYEEYYQEIFQDTSKLKLNNKK